MLRSISAARSGTVGRRSAARPRSSGSETRPRSSRTNGSETSSVSSELWTPGRSSLASERSGGNDSLSACERRHRGAQRVRQLADGRAQVGLLAREGGRGGVEVGDQRLELLAVAVERGGGRAGVLRRSRRGRGRSRRSIASADDRRVAVGGLPVRERAVEAARAGALERRAVLAQQDLEVLARVGLQRGQHLVELHRRGGLLDRERARRRRARASTASRPSGRRRSCPRGRSAAGSWPSRRCGPGGPCRRSAWSRSRPSRPARSTPVTLPTSTPAIRTGEPGRMLLELSNAALIS